VVGEGEVRVGEENEEVVGGLVWASSEWGGEQKEK